MQLETEAEPMVSIPRVPIHIPGGLFSKLKFEPEYVLPLFHFVWKSTITDPTDSVRIKKKANGDLDWPAEQVNKAGDPDPVFAVSRVPADDPCRWEELRLRRDFGDDVFEKVYPGRQFAQDFAALMKPAAPTPAAIPAKK